MTEQLVSWGIAIALVCAIVIPYFLHHRRRIVDGEQRKAEAVRLRIDRPLGQFPYIDPLRCAGCSACVNACPEGDVLGMAGGIAVIVNGLRCIGVAACEAACPVDAITVGLGDVKSREDIPLLDDHLETNLPGVFIAGELGGFSLVSNAVRQGRIVAARVAGTRGQSAVGSESAVDLAIVGAGPAGLSAGLGAQSASLSHVILEREAGLGGTVLNYPRRKMVLTQPVEISPSARLAKESYQKEDLLEMFEKAVADAELQVRFGQAVTGISSEDGVYSIQTADNRYLARNVLLALGRRGNPRKLNVPGENQAKVMYRLIDADSYSGERILVVGGGDSAVEAAMALARDGANEVAISYRKEKLVRIKQRNQEAIDRMIAEGLIRPLFPSQIEEITAETVKLKIGENESVELPNDYVFVCIGGEPPFKFLKTLGVQFGGEQASV